MTRSYLKIVVLISTALIQSCYYTSPGDIKKASEKVVLTKNDLVVFSGIRDKLGHDLPILKKQDSVINGRLIKSTTWIRTNSYYLNQVDSPGYHKLFSKLKCEWKDDFQINNPSQVIFTLKQYVQYTSSWTYSYTHELISANCNCPLEISPADGDTIYVDSVIDKNWRYRYYKMHGGH